MTSYPPEIQEQYDRIERYPTESHRVVARALWEGFQASCVQAKAMNAGSSWATLVSLSHLRFLRHALNHLDTLVSAAQLPDADQDDADTILAPPE